jgi:hypothetical protein
MNRDRDRCDQCWHWNRTGEIDGATYGECRIDSPVVKADGENHPYAPQETERLGEREAWGWYPLQWEHDWCGEFDPGEDEGEGDDAG